MGGLCDVWVMVFFSVVEWEGLDEEGDLGEKKMGFGCAVSWIPTLTRSFILSVRSRKWGNGESRLRVENERLDGVPVGESWESPGGARGDSTCWAVGAGGDSSCWVVGAGGDSSCWAVGAGGDSSCWAKDDAVKASRCAVLHGQSLSQAVAIFLQKAFLSVILDCLASCPWQGLLVTDAKNKKCCSLTAVLLTC